MTGHQSSRFGGSIIITGDEERVYVQLQVFDERDEGEGLPMRSEVFWASLEGGNMTREDWMREVLVAIVEKI